MLGKPGAWAGSESLWWLGAHLEAVGSGQVLLCACLAHRSLDWTPDGVAAVQGQARAAGAVFGGTLQYRGPQGQGASPLSALSLRALPSGTVGALAQPVVCASNCLAALFPPAKPPPQGSDLRPAGSGPSGAGAWRSLGWRALWLCLCILLLWDPRGIAPAATKWARTSLSSPSSSEMAQYRA